MWTGSQRFVRDERGLETVEYAVIVALIVAGVVVAVAAMRDKIIEIYTNVTSTVNG